MSAWLWLLLTVIAQQLGALEQDGRCVLVVQRQLQVVRIDRTPLQRRRTCQLSSAVICETNGENHAKQTETLGWKQAKSPSGNVVLPLPPVAPRP